MKTYRVSKFYDGIYLIAVCFLFAYTALCIYIMIELDFSNLSVFTFVIGIVGISAYICQILTDFLFAHISFDAEGVTMAMILKKRRLRWDEFTEYGIAGASVDIEGNSTFWVYGSRRALTQQEKRRFLNKTRRKLDGLFYFQYNKEPFDEMLPYIPEYWQQVLRDEEAWILENMRFGEKLYHK